MTEKLDVLRLTFYTAPTTVIVILPFYLILEHRRLEEYIEMSSTAGYACTWNKCKCCHVTGLGVLLAVRPMELDS